MDARWTGTIALGVLLLAACTSAPGGAGNPDPTTDAPVVGEAPGGAASGDPVGMDPESAAERAEHLGIEDPPDVEPIRNIAPDGSGLRVLAECMADKGYDYTMDPSGEAVNIDLQGFSEEQHNLDTYICEMQYPVETRFRGDNGEREWLLIYDHFAEEYIPCVREQGYVVQPVPTVESYLEGIRAGRVPHTPVTEVWDQVQVDVDAGRYGSVDEFHRTLCRDTVDLDVLFPAGER